MQWLPTRDWFASATRRRFSRRTSLPWRGVLLVWAAVLAAVSLPPGPGSVALAQRPEVTENSLGMKLVKIPAGEFEMGSNDFENEKPIHRVRITRAFLMGQTEVTQAQWRKVILSSPWKGKLFAREGTDVAATYVLWEEAVEFCARLTKLEQSSGKLRGNRQYRLPTEAEWEYACRAGTKTKFSFGDDEARLRDFAWFNGNGDLAGGQYAREVGQKKPNPWGLYDMHGNVEEWCSDWYDKNYYAHSPAADPQGPDAGSFRVGRGGGWRSYPVGCRSARRHLDAPAPGVYGVGFRVVLSLE
jgi:formylglycine-generating enzyme required for sulfatase activity